MSQIVAKPQTAVKVQSLIEWAEPVLTIRVAGQITDYDVSEFPTPWDGRAFHLRGGDGTSLDTFVCRQMRDDHCDCADFACGNRCRHVGALRYLMEAGEIEDPREGMPNVAYTPAELAEMAGEELPF